MLLDLLVNRYMEPEEEPAEDPDTLEDLQEDPEAQEDPADGYSTDRREELRPSDFVSPFALTIIGKKKYLQLLEYAEDLEKDNKRMARKLAQCEGRYYLQDSQTWSRAYIEAQQARAKAEADAARLQQITEDQAALIERYRAKIRSMEAQADFTRDEVTGQIQSTDGVDKKTKQRQAYFLKLAGKSNAEIAAAVGCGAGSVNVYVSNGKKLLKDVKLEVGADGVPWTSQESVVNLDINGNSKTQPGFHVVGSSVALFQGMTAAV